MNVNVCPTCLFAVSHDLQAQNKPNDSNAESLSSLILCYLLTHTHTLNFTWQSLRFKSVLAKPRPHAVQHLTNRCVSGAHQPFLKREVKYSGQFLCDGCGRSCFPGMILAAGLQAVRAD